MPHAKSFFPGGLKFNFNCFKSNYSYDGSILTLLHSERPKLHTILAFLSAVGLNMSLDAGCAALTAAQQQGTHLYSGSILSASFTPMHREAS